MPTDTDPGGAPDRGHTPAGAGDDLVFAAEDLRRERPRETPLFDDSVTFAATPRAADAAAAAAAAARRAAGSPAAAPAAPSGFQVFSSKAAAKAEPEKALPWTVRDTAPAQPSRRGWNARQSGAIEQSAVDTLRRLREDAVHVSWKSAWIAISSAEGRTVRSTDL
jgi:hypothetical protein